MSQSEFAKIGGVTKKTQMLYESGERVPDAKYLLALEEHNVSSLYYLTGSDSSFSANAGDISYSLDADEQKLVSIYRKVSPFWRDAALSVLKSGERQLATEIGKKAPEGAGTDS